jgi:hypothetical protein
MANNPNNIRLSACHVRWGGRDLGLTKGGVDVTIKSSSHAVTVDQTGDTPANEFIIGRTLTVKCPFAETDLDTLYALMRQSGATLSDTGTTATNTITMGTIPTAADTVTLNGHIFTFVATNTVSPGADQVVIGGTIALTLANLLAVVQASSDPAVTAGVYTATATTFVISYFRSGVIGNSYTIAKSSTGLTVTGSALTGGTDGYRSVSITTGNGLSMLTNALPLVLHPANRADDDASEDFIVPLAGQSGSVSFSYKFDNERIYMVEFTGYSNASTGVLCSYGSGVANV